MKGLMYVRGSSFEHLPAVTLRFTTISSGSRVRGSQNNAHDFQASEKTPVSMMLLKAQPCLTSL